MLGLIIPLFILLLRAGSSGPSTDCSWDRMASEENRTDQSQRAQLTPKETVISNELGSFLTDNHSYHRHHGLSYLIPAPTLTGNAALLRLTELQLIRVRRSSAW